MLLFTEEIRQIVLLKSVFKKVDSCRITGEHLTENYANKYVLSRFMTNVVFCIDSNVVIHNVFIKMLIN